MVVCEDKYFCRWTQAFWKIDKIAGNNCVNLAVAYLGEIPNLTNVLVSHKYTNASLFTKFTEEI